MTQAIALVRTTREIETRLEHGTEPHHIIGWPEASGGLQLAKFSCKVCAQRGYWIQCILECRALYVSHLLLYLVVPLPGSPWREFD